MVDNYDRESYYDRKPRKDERRPRRRNDESREKLPTWSVVLLGALLFGIVAFFWWAARTDGRMGANRTDESQADVTEETHGTVIKASPLNSVGDVDVYVFIDPDTSEEYLVTEGGGITPRIRTEDEGYESYSEFEERGL